MSNLHSSYFEDQDYRVGSSGDDFFSSSSDNRSPSSSSSSSESFSESSLNYSSNSDYDFATNSSSRKRPKKPKPTGSKQTGRQSGPRKSYSKTFSPSDYVDEPRKTKKVSYEEFSDSSFSSDDDFYDFEAAPKKYNKPKEPKWDERTNETTSESESSSSPFSDEYGEPRQKEEYTGPLIERVIGTEIRKMEEKRRYYCKIKNESYIHCQWMNRAQIEEYHNGEKILKKWKREKKKTQQIMEPAEESVKNLQILSAQREDIINPEYFEVFRVIAYDPEIQKYLVQWSAAFQPSDEFTWESGEDIDNEAALNAFKEREDRYEQVKLMPKITSVSRQDPNKYFEYTVDNLPKFKDGLELRDYQLEGLNWLRKCWYYHRSSILADEMGLGKTVQGVCIVNEIFRLGIRGPFLAIAPKSTLMQWEREFHAWTDLNVVRYSDGKQAREYIRKYELFWNRDGKNDENYLKFEVMLMNYEKLLTPDVQEIVNRFEWEYVLVDEAHKLKNIQNKTYIIFENLIKQGKIKHILLMTGTPMQGQSSAIYGLLHLVDPRTFNDPEGFKEKFDNNENQEELQRVLAPYMLRRVKKEVEKTIGTKEENIIEIEISKTQRSLYQKALASQAGQMSDFGLSSSNVKMQLRKVCNHPYLLQDRQHQIEDLIEPEDRSITPGEQLIRSCGKMRFLDELLHKLYQENSKVLIFSQMTQILDILEDYCQYRQYKFERIDGQVKGNKRQQAMDRFNDPKTNTFIFLLCTKAGGQGLNLTAANYVIIYDSDWNPQNDIQAQARCHRIGQKNKVEVFRLVSRGTYETKMLKDSFNKMIRDQILDKKDNEVEINPALDETKYIIHFDMTDISKPIDEILRNKIQVKTQEDMETNLVSEVAEGDLEDKNIQNPYLDYDYNITRRRKRVIYSSDEDFDDSESYDIKKIDSRIIKMVKSAFLKFGWGKWSEIDQNVKSDTHVSIEDFCAALFWVILNPDHDVETCQTYYEITGMYQLTPNQYRICKRFRRINKTKDDFLRNIEHDIRRVFELKIFNDFFDNENSSIPPIEVESNIPWSPTDDWRLIQSIKKYGWDNWKQICDDIHLQDTSPAESKKFLRNRIKQIFEKLPEYPEFARKFKIAIHTGKSDKEKVKKERHERKRDKKRHQREKREEDPHILHLKRIAKALILYGEPHAQNINEFEQYCSTSNNDDQPLINKIIQGTEKLLSSKNRNPDIVFEDQRELKWINEQIADKILTTVKWFQKFHNFYSNIYNSSKLADLTPNPKWWRHENYDPIIFDHVDKYGFSRMFSLITKPEFIIHLNTESQRLAREIAKEEQTQNKTHNANLSDADEIKFLYKKVELMKFIDIIVDDMQEEPPQVVVVVDPSELKFELPKILGNSFIESLGEGEFRAIDGYLYRQGFLIQVKYQNSTYKCSITNSGYTPFSVTTPNGREFSGNTPLDAWSKALDGKVPTSNPFELFGIGLPSVRYWMQKELGDKRVSDYRTITFENKKTGKENKPPKLHKEKADEPMAPLLRPKKKNIFFPLS